MSSLLLLLLLLITITTTTTTTISITRQTTHLHMFLHDTVTGPNISAKIIVPTPTNNSPPNFTLGVITATDDPLTEGPTLTSKLLGRAQGLYTVTSLESIILLYTVNFVFVEGKYNGSTLAVLARDDTMSPVRELPIVGGTGKFRMARGYGFLKTHWFNFTAGNAIFELDLYVVR